MPREKMTWNLKEDGFKEMQYTCFEGMMSA